MTAPVAQAVHRADAPLHDAPLPVFLFCDLDDSLFNSLSKQALKGATALQAAALLANGTVISATNPKQRRFLRWLLSDAQLIPVTARSRSAFARVLLPFKGPAIVSFGACLLNAQGEVDPQWAQYMKAQLQDFQAALQGLQADLEAQLAQYHGDLSLRTVNEDGVAQYLVVKHPGGDLPALAHLRSHWLDARMAREADFCLHQNGNNIALMPRALDKSFAVAELLSRLREAHGEILSIGIGDSFSDARFLALCDYAITPQGTQLGQKLWAP